MGIRIQRIGAAQLFGLLVHGGDESLQGVRSIVGRKKRSDALRDSDGGVVSRRHHQRVKGGLQIHGIALQKPRRRLAHRRRLFVHGDHGVKRRVLKRHDGRHDLGDRGDFHRLRGIAREIHGSVLGYKQSVFRLNIGTKRRGYTRRRDGLGNNLVGRTHVRIGGQAERDGKNERAEGAFRKKTCNRSRGRAPRPVQCTGGRTRISCTRRTEPRFRVPSCVEKTVVNSCFIHRARRLPLPLRYRNLSQTV